MPSPGNVQDKFCGTRATVDSGLMNVRALFRQLTKSNIPHHRQICRWVSPTQHQLQLTHTSESRWQSLLRFSRGLVRGITAPRDEEATAATTDGAGQKPNLLDRTVIKGHGAHDQKLHYRTRGADLRSLSGAATRRKDRESSHGTEIRGSFVNVLDTADMVRDGDLSTTTVRAFPSPPRRHSTHVITLGLPRRSYQRCLERLCQAVENHDTLTFTKGRECL